MGNTLILFGVLLLLFGFLMNMGFPKLPGDIFVQKQNSTFYFPIVTSIVISIVLTVILNLFR